MNGLVFNSGTRRANSLSLGIPSNMRRCFLLTGLLCLIAPLRAVAAEAPAPSISAIVIEGRANVPEATIREAFALKVGDAAATARVEADRKALLALGFFRNVAVSQQKGDRGVQITFRVTELPRVAKAEVSGNTVIDSHSIRQVVSTSVGQVLCVPQLQDDIRAIEMLYRERGYVARVSEKLVDEAARSGVLQFEIREVRIDQLLVEGADSKLLDRARAVLKETPPALYRPEAVTLDQERLLKLHGVLDAVARVETIGPGKVRLRWQLNPSTPAEERAK